MQAFAISMILGLLLPGGAVVSGIGQQDIQRALTLSRRSDAERARFHSRYVVSVGGPTLERVEVITEFRRVVLAAEDRIRLGDYMFGVREAEALLRPWRGRVSIIAHLRFHPQNAYVSVPPYELALAGLGDPRERRPLEVQRTPLYASALAATGSHLIGAAVQGVFDAAPLSRARCRLIVRLSSQDLAGVAVDFAAME